MRKILITFSIVVIIVLIAYVAIASMNNPTTNTMNNSMNTTNNPQTFENAYKGTLGEAISYTDHPLISIADVMIAYKGSTPIVPATETRVALSGTDSFQISASNGKQFDLNWSSGTGDLPGPSHFRTADGCYKLHVNVRELEGGRSEDLQGKVLLEKVTQECPGYAKDLR